MRFSAHRSGLSDGEDEAYDSLWSDSEEDEFPVNPSDSEETPESDDDDVDTPPASEKAENDNNEKSRFSIDSFSQESEAYARNRQSLLAHSSPVGHVSRSMGPKSSPVITTKRRMSADLEELQNVMNRMTLSHSQRYQQMMSQESDYVHDQIEHIKTNEKKDLGQIQNRIKQMTERRRSLILDWRREEERKERERREREEAIRLEEERKRLEEQRRLEQIEAEERRREEEKREAERKRLEEEQKAAEAKEKAKQEAIARAKKEAEVQAAEKAKAEEEARNSSAFTDFKQIEAEFARYKSKIADIKANVLGPVSADKTLKRYCFDAKRKIKPKLGQLTHSQSHLDQLQASLNQVLDDAKGYNNLAYQWLMNFFCKAVVSQAETEATVAPQAALPLALFTLNTVIAHPEMKEFLMARFIKKCPHIIGYASTVETEEGRIRMGWKRSSDGKWEEDSQYSERIAGMVSVWAALTQINIPSNPIPMNDAWVFLARQLNKDPKLTINSDFSAVGAWWDVSAQRFLDTYGKQGTKLLTLVWDEWTNAHRDKRFPAAARLRILGEEWIKNGVANQGLKPMER